MTTTTTIAPPTSHGIPGIRLETVVPPTGAVFGFGLAGAPTRSARRCIWVARRRLPLVGSGTGGLRVGVVSRLRSGHAAASRAAG